MFTTVQTLFRLSPAVSTLIHGLKYRHLEWHATYLSSYLRFRPELMCYLRGFEALIPVPLHPVRKRERGYNQAESIARSLAKMTGLPVWDKVLARIRNTGTQTQLNRDSRQNNLAGAFALRKPGSILAGRRVLVVDDVFTTGATLGECASALLKGGCAEVGVFALARAETDLDGDDFTAEMQAVAGYLV